MQRYLSTRRLKEAVCKHFWRLTSWRSYRVELCQSRRSKSHGLPVELGIIGTMMVSRFVSSRHETLGVWPMISRGAVNTIHLESLLIVQNLNTYCQVSGGFSYTFVKSPTGASRASREVKRPVANNASLCCLCGKSLVAMLTLYKSPLSCFRAYLIVLQHCSHRTIVILDKGFLIMSFSSPLYVRVTRFSIFPFSPLV